MTSILTSAIETVQRLETRRITGRVAAVRGLSLEVTDLPLPVGAVVRVESGQTIARGEVVGFDGHTSIVMLFDHAAGVAPGARVIGEQSRPGVAVGQCLLGRVINGLAQPIDATPLRGDRCIRPLRPAAVRSLDRRRITTPLATGVRAIDGMLTLGQGQRIGIFSGAGVGKSTLLGAIAKRTTADVNVIALIGERGREVREFIDDVLGTDGLERSVVVVATGDESPLLRVRAALTACAVAEYFRELGRDVCLMMDSITRFAQAQRQIGLTAGEMPATRGYTPSVFAEMAMLMERAGAIEGGGSITGLYAVLVDGDDLDEPISDAARGILDGHIILSRKLAERGHYPAIDVVRSISRLAAAVTDDAAHAARLTVQRLLAAYDEAEELIRIGAYAAGSNPVCDTAIAMQDDLNAFLQQGAADVQSVALSDTHTRLTELAARAAAGGAS